MRLVWGMLCFILAFTPLATAQEKPSSKTVFQLNENSGSWSGNTSPKKEGGLNLTYFSAGYSTSKWGVTALGSYADISYVGNGATTGDFQKATLLDSTLSGYYKFQNIGGFDIRSGLDVSLPTGYKNYSEAEYDVVSAFSDNFYQDMNLTTSLGAGLNFSPNLVFSRTFMEKMVIGLGAKYETTGEYDISQSTQNYDPGDTITLIGSMQYLISDKALLFLDATATYSSRDQQNSSDTSKTGDVYDLKFRYTRAFEIFKATFGLSYGLQGKNQQYESSTNRIVTEDSNSNNNKYEFFVNVNYPRSKKLIINGIFGYKNVLENAYNSDDAYYDGGYNKLYLGGGISYIVSNKLFFTVDIRGFQLDNTADATETSDTTYRGYNLDIGFVYSFQR